METGVDLSRPKVIGIGAAGVLAAFALGYFLNLFLQVNGKSGIPEWVSLLLAAVVFLIIFLLQTLFIKSARLLNDILILESLALVAPFILGFSLYVLLAYASALFFFWAGTKRGQREIDNQVKIKFFRIERHTLPHVLTGLSLFMSLVYVNAIGLDKLGVTKKQIQAMLQPAEPLIQRLVAKDFNMNLSVYQFTDLIITQQLAEQLGIQPNLIPATLKNEAISQSLNNLRQSAAGYGIAFKNSDTLSDVVYNYSIKQVERIPSAFRFAIPAGVVLIAFLTVKGVAVLLHWLAALPAYLIYEILLAVGFARLSLESRSREIIILK